MNLQDLWAGHEYAYIENKGRGIDAPYGASRVKLISTHKQRLPGNTRETGFAIVEVLERGVRSLWPPQGTTHQVRARDIIDFWSDYEHRREEIEREQKQREAKREAAINAEKQERVELIDFFAEKTGLPLGQIIYEGSIVGVRSYEVKKWLEADRGGNP